MKNEYLYGLIGLMGGALLVLIFANNAVNSNNSSMMGMMGIHQTSNQQFRSEGMNQMHDQMMGDDEMTMNGMVNGLKGKTGDDFDKTFISEMIDHHQGAIDMAKLAGKNAKHDEIKNLAKGIISAQTKEIDMMKTWQEAWGY